MLNSERIEDDEATAIAQAGAQVRAQRFCEAGGLRCRFVSVLANPETAHHMLEFINVLQKIIVRSS